MKDISVEIGLKGALRIQLLGGFAVTRGERAVPEAEWKSRRASRLVKLLALAPGCRLHRDQVIDALWPESELSAASNSLHQTLYGARRVLDGLAPGCLRLEDGFLSLGLPEGAEPALLVDVEQFESAAVAAKACRDPEAYRSALALYSGDLLPGDLYEEFTLARREVLRKRRVDLLLDLAAIYESRGDYDQGIAALQRLLDADPSHEEAHAGLMRLYALNGQRQQALRQYQALRSALRDELDAEPGERTAALYENILTGQLAARPPGAAAKEYAGAEKEPASAEGERPAAPAPVPRARHNLPYRLSTFIGREKEIDRVLELLRSTRLLTITGAGGVGKTSLAVHAAGYLLGYYPDGAWLVDLAPVTDPALLPATCAQAMDLVIQPGNPAADQLTGYLSGKRLLLILDNCEHLLPACADLARALLSAGPGLTLLVTSREPLGLTGETTYRLPSLAVPDPERLPPLEALGQVEAVRLLLERAGQVAPETVLTEANARAAAQICQRLDGIPLAIELAAARVRVLTIAQIAARLDDAFRLLTGGSRAALPRQQTLRAAIDWSYDLLTPKERLLLLRLSVFVGGCTLEAVEAVCSGDEVSPEEVLDLLDGLVSKSLVMVEDRGGNDSVSSRRYRLLETIRQYGRERLAQSGQVADVRDRHLEYYARLTGQAEPHLRGRGQVEWLARLDDNLDNLRAAMEWSRVGRVELGLQIASDLVWLWQSHGLGSEEYRWIRNLLDAETAGRSGAALSGDRAIQRARALRYSLYHAGFFLYTGFEEWMANLGESIAILREAVQRGDAPSAQRELGISLFYLNLLQERMDLPTEATRDEMLAIFDRVRERFLMEEYSFKQGYDLFYRGELEQSAEWLAAAQAICQEIEDLDGRVGLTTYAGAHALMAGDYQKAGALFSEADDLCRLLKNRWFGAKLNVWMLLIALAQGDSAEVTRLAGEALVPIQDMDDQIGYRGVRASLLRLAWSQGDAAQAQEMAQALREKHGQDALAQLTADLYMGRLALSQEDLTQAEALLRKSAQAGQAVRVLGHETLLVGQENILLAWAALYARQGKAEQAARVLGALDDLYRRTAPSLTPRERADHEAALSAARAALDAAAFEAAWNAGRAMTWAQVLASIVVSD